MRSPFALLMIVVLFPVGVSGEDFYVDPQNGGPGGDGSASNPWRTIQEVVEAQTGQPESVAGMSLPSVHPG